MDPKPSLGRTVHYVLPTGSPRVGEHRAAIITSTHESANVNLNVQLDQSNDWAPACIDNSLVAMGGGFVARAWSAPFDPDCKPGSWHWPERL